MVIGTSLSSQRLAKHGPCVFCYWWFETILSHYIDNAVHSKEECFIKLLKHISHLDSEWQSPRNSKMAALPKRQNNISYIFSLLLQCHPSALFCLMGAPNPSNNRNRCLVILGAARTLGYQTPQERLNHEDFSYLSLMFSRLSRIIMDRGKITSGNMHRLGDSSRRAKCFTHRANFQPWGSVGDEHWKSYLAYWPIKNSNFTLFILWFQSRKILYNWLVGWQNSSLSLSSTPLSEQLQVIWPLLPNAASEGNWRFWVQINGQALGVVLRHSFGWLNEQAQMQGVS